MVTETVEQRNRRRAFRATGFYTLKTIVVLIVVFGAFLMVFPYLYMFFTSFKTSEEVINTGFRFHFFPYDWSFESYIELFGLRDKGIDIFKGFLNTMIIEVFVLIVGTFTTSLAAFAFSRLKFFGKNVVFYILLSGMMIPFVATFLPVYNFWIKNNFGNTLIPLIIPGLFGNVGMLFFVKQYADAIPDEIYEAAEITGAGFFTVYWKLFMPLIRPAIMAQMIFWFLGIWNDFFGPDLYLTDPSSKTLQVLIRYISDTASGGTAGSLQYQPMIMAASVISSVPTLVIYIVFQKYFVNTFMLSGNKG